MSRTASIIQQKIISLQDAQILCAQWKANGEKIVFTNGVFDILHAGHVQSLMAASECGTRLIIGLNADVSVKRLKGDSRHHSAEGQGPAIGRSVFCGCYCVV